MRQPKGRRGKRARGELAKHQTAAEDGIGRQTEHNEGNDGRRPARRAAAFGNARCSAHACENARQGRDPAHDADHQKRVAQEADVGKGTEIGALEGDRVGTDKRHLKERRRPRGEAKHHLLAGNLFEQTAIGERRDGKIGELQRNDHERCHHGEQKGDRLGAVRPGEPPHATEHEARDQQKRGSGHHQPQGLPERRGGEMEPKTQLGEQKCCKPNHKNKACEQSDNGALETVAQIFRHRKCAMLAEEGGEQHGQHHYAEQDTEPNRQGILPDQEEHARERRKSGAAEHCHRTCKTAEKGRHAPLGNKEAAARARIGKQSDDRKKPDRCDDDHVSDARLARSQLLENDKQHQQRHNGARIYGEEGSNARMCERSMCAQAQSQNSSWAPCSRSKRSWRETKRKTAKSATRAAPCARAK